MPNGRSRSVVFVSPVMAANLCGGHTGAQAGSPADLLALNKSELARCSKAVEDAGAKLQN